jgi:RNA polymerase sigma factor (sigma-70 family)
MRTSPTSSLIDHLRRAALLPDRAGLGDGELLGRFLERHDEAAFAVLVNRHGPMVWGVCRRLLHQHDAEDAFQATFLVLARKAASIRSKELVGNWLYGVAHQTALQARRTAARRRAKEVQVTKMPDTEAVEPGLWADLQPLLDQELSRLPDIYRAVIVLCDLEGRTRREVACRLGMPEGTVAGRLARARTMLAKRLTQRGVTLSGAALGAVLAQQAVSAGVQKAVVVSTIKAASQLAAGQAVAGAISVKVAALTEGVMKAMLLTKLKTAATGLLLVVAALCGAAGLIFQTQAAEQPQGYTGSSQEQPVTAKDLDRLQGTWEVITEALTDDLEKWTIAGRTVTITIESKKTAKSKSNTYRRFRLDETTKPKRIDFVEGDVEGHVNVGNLQGHLRAWDELFDDADTRREGVYDIAGDTLRICVSRKRGYRPRGFPADDEPASDWQLWLLVRKLPKDEMNKHATAAASLSVELLANKDVKIPALKVVMSAVEKIEGVKANVSFGVQETEGMSARIHAPPELPQSKLLQVMQAMKKAGVVKITLVPEKAAMNMSVVLLANKDVQVASLNALKAVKRTVEDVEGVKATVSIGVQEAEGISARIHASRYLPYDKLFQVMEAMKKAGVGKITIVTEKGDGPGQKTNTGQEEKTSMAWGKEVDGLQAGIRLKAIDVLDAAHKWVALPPVGKIHPGSVLRFEVIVRNVSKQEVRLKYVEPSAWFCSEDGRDLKFSPAYVGGIPIGYEKTLKPGEGWEVAQLNIHTRRPKPTESFSGLVLPKLGKFRVSCPAVLMQQKLETKLATGEVQIDIVPPTSAKPGEVDRGEKDKGRKEDAAR